MIEALLGFDYVFDISFFQLCLLASLLGLISKFLISLLNIDNFISGTYQNFVFSLLPVTGLVITSTISDNIALSLGMVGALSIVRFRTPIKEPEELAYLFICIAAGLGYGANQTVPTTVAVIIILFLIYLLTIFFYY